PSGHEVIRSMDDIVICYSCGGVRTSPVAQPTIPPFRFPSDLDGKALQTYQYRDIDRESHQMRLLILLPGAKADDICCRMVTTSLDSNPSYSAVSYTWATENGDKSVSKKIYIADIETPYTWHFLLVTTNCENALRQLRQADQPGVIWIDSICINQLETDERSHQVGLMDRIYQGARSVEICIHNPAKDYRAAMNLLAFLPPDRLTVVHSEDRVSTESRPKPDFLTPIMNLFGNCEYFSRVWVVQEVLLAASIYLHVNDEVVLLTWEKLQSALDICVHYGLFILRLFDWMLAWRRQTHGRAGTRIVSSLSMSLKSSCEDPRDHVFGILSLLSPEIRALIAVDYTATEDQVLQQAVAACVFECGDLDILCFCELNQATDITLAPSFTERHLKSFLGQ
ncbi:heterokaryon incompatibility protein-domain-containing protein, partial [Paraphoma chrysanthemicola]